MGNAGTRTGVVIVFLLGTQFKAQVFDYTVINSTHSSIRQAGTSRARVHLWNSRQEHTMHNCIIHNQQHSNVQYPPPSNHSTAASGRVTPNIIQIIIISQHYIHTTTNTTTTTTTSIS